MSAATRLCCIDKIRGTNSNMHYIAGALAFFSCHVEDEKLSSISHILVGAEKVWYVEPRSSKVRFETFVARELLAP